MPTLAVPEFQAALAELTVRAGAGVDILLGRLDRRSPGEARGFVTDAYPHLIDPFLSAAGELTTQWYAEQPTKPVARGAAVFSPEPAALVPRERLAISARWALTQSNPVVALQGSATRAVFDQSRNTVIVNARREKVRWARHASANACGFCRLLAIRGAVYHSKAKALRVHDHCRCLATPVRDGLYEPAPYVEQWERAYKAAREAGASTPGQIASFMDPARVKDKATGDVVRTAKPKPNAWQPRKPKPDQGGQPSRASKSAGGQGTPVESQADIARRLVPGLEESLAELRAQGLAANDQKIVWHERRIAELRDQADRRATRENGTSEPVKSVGEARTPEPASGTDRPGGPPKPPRNIPPVAGSPDDEYGPLHDGRPSPVRPSDIAPIEDEDIDYIYEGDGYGGGRHKSGGGITGKSEFSRDWGKLEIREAVEAALWSPAVERRLKETARGVVMRALYERTILEIPIAKHRDGDWSVTTAYPLCGDGVVMNDPDKGPVKKPLKLDRLDFPDS